VGIARYVRDAHDPHAAEIAVTIVDDWQGRGLGTELLAQLSDRASREGIRYFTALVSVGNVAIAGLLRNVSAELVRRGPGTVEYKIALAPEEEHSPGRGGSAHDGCSSCGSVVNEPRGHAVRGCAINGWTACP
jgi:GNAT superfamily N-acetyltransferase